MKRKRVVIEITPILKKKKERKTKRYERTFHSSDTLVGFLHFRFTVKFISQRARNSLIAILLLIGQAVISAELAILNLSFVLKR